MNQNRIRSREAISSHTTFRPQVDWQTDARANSIQPIKIQAWVIWWRKPHTCFLPNNKIKELKIKAVPISDTNSRSTLLLSSKRKQARELQNLLRPKLNCMNNIKCTKRNKTSKILMLLHRSPTMICSISMSKVKVLRLGDKEIRVIRVQARLYRSIHQRLKCGKTIPQIPVLMIVSGWMLIKHLVGWLDGQINQPQASKTLI
jgi:hypothetical protein